MANPYSFNGNKLTTYKDGSTPADGTPAQGTIFENEYARVYLNTNYLKYEADLIRTDLTSLVGTAVLDNLTKLSTAVGDDPVFSTHVLLLTGGTLTGNLIAPTIYGGVAANDDITIGGTSHGTKTTSYVLLQPSGGLVGIGKAAPTVALDVVGAISTTLQITTTIATGNSPFVVSSITQVNNLNSQYVNGKSVGTSGNVIALLDGANTWSGNQTISSILNSTNTTDGGSAVGAITTSGGIYAAKKIYSDDTLTISKTTNQLILGTTRTVTITAPTPATASRIHTIPDVGAAANFIMSEGTQTINGAKTFGSVIAAPTSDNTINGLIITAGALSGITTLNMSQNLTLANTTSAATYGIIYKGSAPFIHNYYNIADEGMNTFVGEAAGNLTLGSNDSPNTDGSRNTGIGISALHALTTGYRNSFLGSHAGQLISTGYGNVGIGSAVCANLTTGYENVFFGAGAGVYYYPSVPLTNAIQSVFLGAGTQSSANGNSNEIVIGYNAIGNGSNTVTLGNTSITGTYLQGKTSIGGALGTDQLRVYDVTPTGSPIEAYRAGSTNVSLKLTNGNGSWYIGKSSAGNFAIKQTDADIASAALVTVTSAGLFGIGTIPSYKLDILNDLTNATGNIALNANMVSRTTSNATGDHYGTYLRMNPVIASGVTVTGSVRGILVGVTRNNSTYTGDAGTQSILIGQEIIFGHSNGASSPVTASVYGLKISPRKITGSITEMIDLYLSTGVTGITPTNHWGIFQEATNIKNYLGSAVGIGVTTPTSTSGGLDISSGGIGLVIGAESGLMTRTNSTTKYGRIAVPHYTNTEEPVSLIMGSSSSTYNTVYIGGGNAALNAATEILFYTAANNTTTTGTERMRITSAGYVQIGSTTATNPLHVTGNIYATGTITAGSARALKTDIKVSTINASEIINGVKIVDYKYKADDKKEQRCGFIADDTHALLAGSLHDKIDITNSIGVLIKALQESNDRIKILEEKIRMNERLR